MHPVKSMLAAALLFTGVVVTDAESSQVPQPGNVPGRTVVDNAVARDIVAQVRNFRSARFVIDTRKDADGNVIAYRVQDVATVMIIKDVMTFVPTDDGGLVISVTFYPASDWISRTAVYPIRWFDTRANQWVLYKTYDDRIDAQAVLRYLRDTYGDKFKFSCEPQWRFNDPARQEVRIETTRPVESDPLIFR